MFVLVSGAGVGFSIYYGNGIQDRILKELNKNLKTKVVVNGPVRFSVFSYFPNASLQINDIVVMGSTGAKNDTLLKAGKLSLLMNVFDVINRKWNIKSIVIEKGDLKMFRRSDGVTNYDITKSSGNSKDTTSIFVNITEAVFKDVNIAYTDKSAQTDIALAIDEVSLEGNFSSAELGIKAEGAFVTQTVNLKGIDYGKDRHVSLAGTFEAAPGKNAFTVKSDNILIEDNHFSLTGTVSSPKDETNMDIHLKGVDLTINSLLKLFPEQYAENWTDYDASGNLQFDVTVKGVLSKTQNPAVNIAYKVNKTQLRYKKMGKDIKDLSFDGSYTNGTQHNLATSEIDIKGLNGYLGDKPLYIQFNVKNLNEPNIHLEADGYLGLEFFNKLLPDSGMVHDLQGGLMIQGLTYNGLLDNLKPTTEQLPDIKGDFTFQDCHVRLGKTDLDIPSGTLKLTPSYVGMNDVQLKMVNSVINMVGAVEDWKGYTYAMLNANPVAAKPIKVNLSLGADKIELENFVDLFGTSSQPQNSSASVQASTKPATFSDLMNINGSLAVKVKDFSYKKFKAQDLNGAVILTPGHAELSELSMKTMGGTVLLTSSMNVVGNNVDAQSTLHSSNVDVSDLFTEMDNFGQTQMTNKNIKGKLTSTLKINTYIENGNIDLKKLYVLADVKIENGELVSFKPLKSLSKFIDVDELEDVKFSTLQNQIEIKNQVINIPAMIVKTSAINLSLSGTHTFDNYVDYRLKVNFYDVLAKKIKKKRFNKDAYEVVDDNSFNFFISMKGPIDNPDVRYDKQSVIERFKQQGKEIKDNIKGIKEQYNKDKEHRDWDTDTLQFMDWDSK